MDKTLALGEVLVRRGDVDDRSLTAAGKGMLISKKALWRIIREELESDLASGRFKPGDRLPGEHALAARFGATRNTVRRALAELQAAGALRTVHGGGSFVCESPFEYELGDRTRFTENLNAQSAAGARKLLSSRRDEADRAVADALGISPGSAVVVLELTLEIEDRIVGYGFGYYEATRFDGIDDAFRQTGSISKAQAMFGVHDYRRVDTSMIARMPTATEARILRQPHTVPVIEQTKINADLEGRPVLYGVTVYAAERVRFTVKESGDRNVEKAAE